MADISTVDDKGVKAIVIANVDFRKLGSVATALLQFNEVRKIFVTTGNSNLAIEITSKTVRSFHEFLTAKLSNIRGLSVASSNMVTQVMMGKKKRLIDLTPVKYSDPEL